MAIQWVIPKPNIGADQYIHIELLEGQTEQDVNKLFESLEKAELKDRVVSEDALNKNFNVDNVFRISRSVTDLAKETISQWMSRKIQYQGIMTAELLIGLGGLGICLYSNRWYLIVASFVAAVYLLRFAGIAYAIYGEADHEFQVWTKPEVDFLQRRNRALSLPPPQIFENKCRYRLNPKQGTLTDLEVLVLWKRDFNKFAEDFLAPQPKNAEEEKQWLNEFAAHNILSLKWFESKKDTQVLDAKGWERVKEYQIKMDALVGPLDYRQVCRVLQEAKDVLIEGKVNQVALPITSIVPPAGVNNPAPAAPVHVAVTVTPIVPPADGNNPPVTAPQPSQPTPIAPTQVAVTVAAVIPAPQPSQASPTTQIVIDPDVLDSDDADEFYSEEDSLEACSSDSDEFYLAPDSES